MQAAGLILRGIIALASFGMMVCAVILLGHSGANIAAAAQAAIGHDPKAVGLVMKTIDECLFAIILILLGGKVAATFVLSERVFETRDAPRWMRPSDLGELKSTFCQAILVYLIVDFATDVATVENNLEPGYLVLPLAILLIAAALKLMPHAPPAGAPDDRTPTH